MTDLTPAQTNAAFAKYANSADLRRLGLLGKTAGSKSMEESLQGATDRFGKTVVREMTKLLKTNAKGKAEWTDIKADTASAVTFKVGGQAGRISVFFFAGPKKDIEVQAEVKGKSWMKQIPLNMTRDAKTIASDAFYSVPAKMRP